MSNYPSSILLNKNRYLQILEENFMESDKSKWKFGKKEMKTNPDIGINRSLLKNLIF